MTMGPVRVRERLSAREVSGTLGEAVGTEQLTPERAWREVVGRWRRCEEEAREEAWLDERAPFGLRHWNQLTRADAITRGPQRTRQPGGRSALRRDRCRPRRGRGSGRAHPFLDSSA
jgi:hypothetical protein